MTEWTEGGKTLRLEIGNIALMEADALVNAANTSLILGGGVAGAIKAQGGPTIQEECNRIGPIEVGEAVLTGGGNLKARHVIHAAGPVYGEGGEDEKLRNATVNSLKLAQKHGLNSLIFPAIGTGIFRFPLRRCSEIMLQTAVEWLRERELPREVTFCLYDEGAFNVFVDTLEKLTVDGS